MLSEKYDADTLVKALAASVAWRPYPPAADREAWEGLLSHPLNHQRRVYALATAEKWLDEPNPVLPLRGYWDFVRDGDRGRFEKLYFARRKRLASMVLAACLSGERRFVEAAAEISWTMCEETSWAVPAHAERRSPDDPAPEIRRPTLDLFSCETAAVLATAAYLLQGEFESISPIIGERVRSEIIGRIVEPFETRDDFQWLNGINNWTPWCVASTLTAACHVIADNDRLAKLIVRVLPPLDRFIENYPLDGCCDEGPMYWGAAPGALLLALETLYSRTGGLVDIYGEPVIKAMANYVNAVQVFDGWVFNYSDCPPRVNPSAARLYRFGERLGERDLRDLAIFSQRGWKADGQPNAELGMARNSNCDNLGNALRELFWMPAEVDGGELNFNPVNWYPHTQMLVARSSRRPAEGLVLCAKGGHNGENHNHNDIGSFAVYAEGSPVIVDPGRGEYTRQTFEPRRYELWWNAGRGHDVPQFDGHEQMPGADSRAELVDWRDSREATILELELAAAYPPEAGLETWRRRYELVRGESARITIRDSFRSHSPVAVVFPLFTPAALMALRPGAAEFALPSAPAW